MKRKLNLALLLILCLSLIFALCACGDGDDPDDSSQNTGDPNCDHDYGWEVTTFATCAAPGVRTGTCSKCGATTTGEIPQSSVHSFGDYTATTPAQCGVAGEETRICSVCQTPQTRSIPALSHNYPNEWTRVSGNGCTSDLVEKRVCANNCGVDDTKTTTAQGHNITAWQDTISAQCESEGEHQGVCQRCNETVTESTPALGHDEVVTGFVAPTDTTVGNTGTITCSRCPDTIRQPTEIPALSNIASTSTATASVEHRTVRPEYLIDGNYKTCVIGNYHAGSYDYIFTYEQEVYASCVNIYVGADEDGEAYFTPDGKTYTTSEINAYFNLIITAYDAEGNVVATTDQISTGGGPVVTLQVNAMVQKIVFTKFSAYEAARIVREVEIIGSIIPTEE